MKIHAYQETLTSKAQSKLGDVFDYAINVCNIPGEDFVKMFVVSDVCKKIENRDSSTILDKSGLDLLQDIFLQATGNNLTIQDVNLFSRSQQYWIGYSIAYYQWYSNRSFSQIFEVITYKELEHMCSTLHEADISKFVDIVDSKIKEYYSDTNLKRIRTNFGISQSELAKRSGIGLRSIQMYEQKNKNINKANVETLYRISKVLDCSIEDLIER